MPDPLPPACAAELFLLKCRLRKLEAEFNTGRHGARLRELLALLKPGRAAGAAKIRLGMEGDGGYVMLDDFDGVARAHSLGIADDASWDLAVAGRGIDVDQFDPSIPASPQAHPRFSFFRKEIRDIGDLRPPEGGKELLKIDIEGAEWDFFDRAPSGQLARFAQITGEFHDFDLYHDPEWGPRAARVLAKLDATHRLVHVHGNNQVPSFWTGGMDLPAFLELTYARRGDFRFEETDEPFPGPHDRPNHPGRPDYVLDALKG